MVAYKVVGTESSIADNFMVDRQGDDLLVRWKVFDPDMAFNVAVARSGASGAVSTTDDLGPNVRTTTNRYSGFAPASILSTLLVLTLLVFIIGMRLFFASLTLTDKLGPQLPRFVQKALRRTLNVMAVVLFTVGLYQGVQ